MVKQLKELVFAMAKITPTPNNTLTLIVTDGVALKLIDDLFNEGLILPNALNTYPLQINLIGSIVTIHSNTSYNRVLTKKLEETYNRLKV
jgi:hypothetical protein